MALPFALLEQLLAGSESLADLQAYCSGEKLPKAFGSCGHV